jgi:hypothetical protein
MANISKSLDYLFVSKVRIKALKYFFDNQDKPIHLRAIARELNEEINAVRRELLRLTEIRLLRENSRGNRKYYTLNPGFNLFDELNSMLTKSHGLGDKILKNQAKLGTIYFAAFTYSFTNNSHVSHKDIDLIIIGDVNLDVLTEIIKESEEKYQREINYTVLRLGEFNLRKKRSDQFIISLLLSTKILLVGNREEFIA